MLSIDQIGAIAYDWLKNPQTATVMTAVAMAESGGNELAQGDHMDSLPAKYAPLACGGYLSFGLWQVFLGVHSGLIDRMAGTAEPCTRALWLQDPQNNARAMHAILVNQGYAAWSAYSAGTYEIYMDAALRAVAAAVQGPQSLPVEPRESEAIRLPLSLGWNVVDMNGRPLRLRLEIEEPSV